LDQRLQWRFSRNKYGKPIRPSAAEVREITEHEAERIIDLNDDELLAAVTKYAEEFGPKATAQLERYVRRQQRSR
jgi:hypothetical protein